jgi:hypothetical protein
MKSDKEAQQRPKHGACQAADGKQKCHGKQIVPTTSGNIATASRVGSVLPYVPGNSHHD